MPERGEWFWKDVERMADWAGGEEKNVQPVLVDVIDRMSLSSLLLGTTVLSADICFRRGHAGVFGYAEGYPTG